MGQGLNRFKKQFVKIDKIAIDTPCLLYYIEKNPKYLTLTEFIFEELFSKGKIEIVASTLLLTETLVKPFAQNKLQLVFDYKSIISKNFTLSAVSENIAEQAARLRAKYKMGTPDAIHIATAIESGTKAIVGNDRRWKQVKEIKTLILEEFC